MHGKEIREARVLLGLSQGELGRLACGMRGQLVSEIERGAPTMIAAALRVALNARVRESREAGVVDAEAAASLAKIQVELTA